MQGISPLHLHSYEVSRSSTSLGPWPNNADKCTSDTDTADIFNSTAHDWDGGEGPALRADRTPDRITRVPDRIIRVRRLNSCVASIIGRTGDTVSRGGPMTPPFAPIALTMEEREERERYPIRELSGSSAAKDTLQSQSPRWSRPELSELLIYQYPYRCQCICGQCVI